MRLLISAWIAGELLSLFEDAQHPPWGLLITFGSVAILYGCLQMKKTFTMKHAVIYCIVSAVLFAGGFYWTHYLKDQKISNLLHPQLEDKTFILQGYIDELPRVSDRGISFGFRVTHSQLAYTSLKIDEDISFPQRVYLFYPLKNQQKNFMPGQYWSLKVKLKSVRGLKNPYGFDLEQWMFIQNLGAQGNIQVGSEKALGASHRSFKTTIELLRHKIREKIQESLGKNTPYAGVISALVIGDQQMISPEDWKIFAQTGIGHLISISGLHVTMLAGLGASLSLIIIKRTRLIYWRPAPYFAAFFGFLMAFLYTWLAGFQIPAQRTMMMVGITTLGLYLGRILHAFDIWFWALFLVLACNPWAIFSPGFWLSFGAVAAILFAMPKDKNSAIDIDLLFIQKLRTSLGQAVRVQAVVTIALIPLTLYWFYQISIISPIANAVAIPVISFLVTPFAILGAFLPWYLGDLFLWLAHYIFELLMYLIVPLANFEWATVYGAQPLGWHLLLAVIGVVICVRPGPIASSWKSRSLGFGLCLTLFVPQQYLPGVGIPKNELEMTVWDIGQGNAVLIRTRSHQLLFDTGPISFGKFDPGEKIITPHLRALGINNIDQLVISHQDADHIGGLKYLLENLPIKNAMGSISPDHQAQSIFKKNKVLLQKCEAGQSWRWDGIDFYVWHPQLQEDERAQYKSTKPNEMSCVIEVRHQHHSIWLTGDIEKNAERLIVDRLKEDKTHLQTIQNRNVILMAPHHGSKTSSTPMFLEALIPEQAFSQTGYKNRYQHPHPDVVKRYQSQGVMLLDTVNTGAQIWQTQGEQINRVNYRK